MTKPTLAAIPEERVATILARAAELDRERKETISIDAIRAAALDAGISAAAVDAALEEYAANQEIAPPEPVIDRAGRFGRVRGFFRRAARALRTPLKLGALFLVIGVAGAAGEGAVVLGWMAWLLMAVRLVLRHRRSRRARPFALALVIMTIGLATGFAATEVVDEEAIGMLFPVGLMLLAAGTAVIKVRLPGRWARRGEVAPTIG